MKYIFAFALACQASTTMAETLSTQDRARFIASSTPGCVQRQRQDPVNNSYSTDKLSEYCRCIATNVSRNISVEELEYDYKTQSDTYMLPHTIRASLACSN